MRSTPGHSAVTRGKKSRGKLECVWDVQLILCARNDLRYVSQPFRRLLLAWYRGHVHRLAHGIGNYSETHDWPWARYSAQHYWVRPKLLTHTQSAFESLFTVQNQPHRLSVSCPTEPGLPTTDLKKRWTDRRQLTWSAKKRHRTLIYDQLYSSIYESTFIGNIW